MNIVYVCREMSPFTGGGIGTYISNVVKSMSNKGHVVTVVTDLMGRSLDVVTGFENVEFVCPKEFSTDELGDYMTTHQAYSFRVYRTLLERAQFEDIDLIEFPEFRGEGFACIRAKRTLNEFPNTKLIVKCHTPSSLIREINDEYFYQPRHEMDAYMEDYCVSNADMVTAPSQSLRSYFENRLNRRDIKICPYPLDLPATIDRKRPIVDGIKTVRYLGSIQPRKGVDHFIEAAIRVLRIDPSYIFEIIGGERNQSILWKSYTDHLKSKIPDELTTSFRFPGAVSGEDVPSLLAQSSLCVFPSRWENWANICLEAMSSGCIVCASSNGGMGEMIEDKKSGFHLNPNDPESTARLILRIGKMSDRKLRHISRSASKRAKEISDPNATIKRIEANYHEALKLPARWTENRAASPKVSVIIPFYNQGSTVVETVDSVKASNYPNIEIIVVNDGSDSETANSVFESLEGVVKITKSNHGLSAARNTGIESSTGKYFLPLDSDDLLEPSYIQKAVDCLENNPDLYYVGCHARNFGAFDGNYAPIGFVKSLMAFQNTDVKCCSLFRRSSLGDGYDSNMYSYEDWDYLIHIHEMGGTGDVLPESLFRYRRHYDSMVFSTANHQKAHLLQYMLHKHEKFFASEASKMSRILSRLWSEEQFERNFRNIEVMQVYFGVDGVFSEEHSSILTVYKGQLQNVKFRIPTIGKITDIRIDPCACQSDIRVHRILLRNTQSDSILLDVSDEVSFNRIAIGGTASGSWDKDSLLLRSTGDDPQLYIGGFSTNGVNVVLEIELIIDCLPS